MNRLSSITFGILGVGCVSLIIPIFTPPESFGPPIEAFSPYVVLSVATLLARTHFERKTVLWLGLLVTVIGGYLYLDPIYFNRLFAWHSVGLVASFVPGFVSAPCLALLGVLALRRFRVN